MKRALVTGASGGIGGAICRELAENGYTVLALANGHFAEAEALMRSLGGEAYRCDLSDAEAVRSLIPALGEVELLVNAAGVAWYGLLQQMGEDDWRRLFSVNLDAAYRLCRELIPGMVRRGGGCIVNVASILGTVGGSCEAAYSASKGALIALTKALAKELGPANIRVNAVCPGLIDTAMIADLTEDDRAALIESTALGRIGTPEDIAPLVAFLASDAASFITGQSIGIDGGLIL